MAIEQNQTFITQLSGGGYQMLLLDRDCNNIVGREPVLGFLVFEIPRNDKRTKFHVIYPATSDQVYDGDGQDYALLCPSGQVELPYNRIFPSIEEFEEYLKAKRAKPTMEVIK